MLSLPVHPSTGVTAIGIVGGKPVWPVIGGSEDAPPPPSPEGGNAPSTPPAPAGSGGTEPVTGGESGTGGDSPHGFPADTPHTQMTVEQQVAYWKYHSRKHEDAVNKFKGGVTADDAQALRDRIAALEREKLSEDQRSQADAIEAAKTAAAEEARQQLMPQLRGAELRGFASIVLAGDRLNNWLDTVNSEAFVGEDGHVDGDKVVTHLTTLFGDASSTGSGTAVAQPRHPNYGQGQSGAGRTPRGESGRAEAIRRGWVKPEQTTTTS